MAEQPAKAHLSRSRLSRPRCIPDVCRCLPAASPLPSLLGRHRLHSCSSLRVLPDSNAGRRAYANKMIK